MDSFLHQPVLPVLEKRHLEKYFPVMDDDYRKRFYLGGHLNPMGYILTAKVISSYIDYIVRHNYADFKQVGFIGTPYKNTVDK